MKKIRAIFLSLVMLLGLTTIGVATNTTPVAATASNCSRGGEYYVNGTYAGIACFYGFPGDAVRLTITCRYRLFGVMHTYNVYGGWAYWAYYDPQTSYPGAPGSTGWSWSSCGNHSHDWASGDIYRDRITHVYPQTSPGASYWGYPFTF